MIRKMEKRHTSKVPRNYRCPECGERCVCRRSKKISLADGSEMRVQYCYCKRDGCDGTKKNTDVIDFD